MGKALVIPSIFTAIDKVTAVVRAISRNTSTLSDKFAVTHARGERFFRSINPLGGEAARQMLSFASAASVVAAVMMTLNFGFDAIKQYDASLASLRAITGLTGKEFDTFKSKISDVANSTGKSTIEVAKAFELIGSANSDLLKSADAMAAVTNAAITLSQASGDDLATSASALVGTLNQFNLAATESNRVMDILAKGAELGAATIPQISESMKNVGAVAAGANISVGDTVSLLETLAKSEFKGAEAGTKLRGIIVGLQDAGLGYASGLFNIQDALAEMNKGLASSTNAKQRDAMMLDIFGKENLAAGTALLSNIDTFKEWSVQINENGVALRQAGENTSTITAKIDKLKNKFINIITTSDKTNTNIDRFKTLLDFVTNNMETIIGITATYVGLLIAMKVTLVASSIAIGAYNVALGIYNAITGRSVIYTAAQSTAQLSAAITIKAMTAAQWVLNASLWACPITWIIAGILALIAVVIIIIKYWEEWSAQVTLFLGPLGQVIALMASLYHHWQMISDAFSAGGFLAGIKAIGVAILDSILLPVQQLLQSLNAAFGFDWAGKAAVQLADVRAQMIGASTVAAPSDQVAPPVENSSMNFMEAMREQQIQQSLNIAIKDPGNNAKVERVDNGGLGPIKITSTR